MNKIRTIFICFLLAGATLLQCCTFQGPVKEVITEKWIARANTYMQEGNYEDAITYYTKVLKINPKDAIAYNNRGLAWREKRVNCICSGYINRFKVSLLTSFVIPVFRNLTKPSS